ncbi:hypothetical protein DSO57_1034785 [Entomophthora muscae]|uniref:Uncharacterized protein n=1 Tax=Entomophthora muscae TaxID=34485 RepID=A0ACC2UKN7_9FUNG|nr:hypothetical protein DSO57_1034785 [Entomophthora muscae]
MRVTLSYTDAIPLYLNYISVVGSDLPGILNLIALLIDPAFAAAIAKIRAKEKQEPASLEDGNGLEIHVSGSAPPASHTQDLLAIPTSELSHSNSIESALHGSRSSLHTAQLSASTTFHSNLSCIAATSLTEKL